MIRFGILAGVSSDAQVEDKDSIPDQIKTCRNVIEQFDGVEAGCYIIDGYSRTGYDSLADAMDDIPPLKEAIEAAANNEYDVLLLDNWDRLGDLGQLVHTRYKKYRKQIYSARQSGRLHDPKSYDPYADESAGIDMHVQAIIQQYRLNKLRRGWTLGVTKRITDGLPPFRIPFGYDRVDKKKPPIQNQNARHVIQIKDWFLEGRAVSWIIAQLQAAGIASPTGNEHWNASSIEHVLRNPFYFGVTAIGQKRPEAGKKGKKYRQRTPQSEWTKATGKHIPLWDEETYLAIQNEYARRLKLRNYSKTIYPLAGLFRCTECKQKLVRRHVSRGGVLMPGLGCKRGESHVRIEYDRAVRLLADELKLTLHERARNPVTKQDQEARLTARLNELQEQRALIQEGFEAHIYKKEEAADRLGKIETEELNIQKQLAELQRVQQVRSEFQALSGELMQLDDLATWITTDDPAVINRLLSALCQTVWLDPEYQITIDWME